MLRSRVWFLIALGIVSGGLCFSAALDVATEVRAQSAAGVAPVPIGAFATPAQVQSAIQAAIPLASTAMPPATALDGQTGTATSYARSDHTHAARIQRTAMVTDVNGVAVWTLARPIVVASGKVPPVTYMVEDTGTPVVVQITSRTFTTAGGLDTHTAVTVKAQRSRLLPATLVSLAALINFDVFGTAAGSVRVNLFAADPTQ
jgi:hypothetical protein